LELERGGGGEYFITFPSSNTLFPSLEKENLATNQMNQQISTEVNKLGLVPK
jgi:hypothetical protein